MFTGAWYEWALQIAAGLVVAVSIGIASWLVWGDRARGRKRCPKCWYDMSGAVAGGATGGDADRDMYVCPECGKRTKGERGLARTRRRWKAAAWCALLACFGWQLGWMGSPGREGLKAFVPTVVLIAFEQDFAEAQRSQRMIWVRLAEGVVTPWDRWAASMRELHAAEVDWNKMVWRREKWPTDQGLRIHIAQAWKLQSTFESRTVEMRWSGDPRQVAVVNLWPNYVWVNVQSSPPDYVDLPPPELGMNRYEVIMNARSVDGFGGARRARVVVEIEGVPSMREALVPDDSAAATMEIALKLGWSVEFGGNEAVIALRMPDNWISPWRRVSMAFHAQLYRGAELIAEGVEYPRSGPSSRLAIWTWIPGTSANGPEGIDLTDLWVELTPRPEAALMDFHTNSYWSGSLRLRLTDLPVFGGEYGARKLHDASGLTLMPGNRTDYRRVVEMLPLYTPRAIPLRPATSGELEPEEGKK
jgi:hypothetical protein